LLAGKLTEIDERGGYTALVALRPLRGQGFLVAGARRRQISLRAGSVAQVAQCYRSVPLVPQSTPEDQRFLVVAARRRVLPLLVGKTSEAVQSAARQGRSRWRTQVPGQRQHLLVEAAGALAVPLFVSHHAQVGKRVGDAYPVVELLPGRERLFVHLSRCFVIALKTGQTPGSMKCLRAFLRARLRSRVRQRRPIPLPPLAEVAAHLPEQIQRRREAQTGQSALFVLP